MAEPKRARRRPDNAVRVKPERGEYRGVYVAMIDSPEYEELTEEAAACLWILKLKLGQAGIAVFATESLPRYTKMTTARVSDGLAELRAHDWLIVEGNVFWGRNFLRWDPLRPLAQPNMRKAIEAYIRTLPKLKIVNDFAAYYELEKPFEKVNTPRTHRKGMSKATETLADYGIRNTEYEIGNTEEGLVPVTQPSSSSSDTSINADVVGDDRTPQQQMSALVDAHTEGMEHVAKKKFVANAVGIVDGSDVAVWHDPKADAQVAWDTRPRLLKLALAHIVANPQYGLRSALKYVVKQQLDPFPDLIPEGSEAHTVKEGGPSAEMPGRGRGNGGTSAGGIAIDVGRSVTVQTVKRPTEDDRVEEWVKDHPARAEEIRREVSDAIDADPSLRGLEDNAFNRIKVKALLSRTFKARVIALIGADATEGAA